MLNGVGAIVNVVAFVSIAITAAHSLRAGHLAGIPHADLPLPTPVLAVFALVGVLTLFIGQVALMTLARDEENDLDIGHGQYLPVVLAVTLIVLAAIGRVDLAGFTLEGLGPVGVIAVFTCWIAVRRGEAAKAAEEAAAMSAASAAAKKRKAKAKAGAKARANR
jgi:hypothetical protein